MKVSRGARPERASVLPFDPEASALLTGHAHEIPRNVGPAKHPPRTTKTIALPLTPVEVTGDVLALSSPTPMPWLPLLGRDGYFVEGWSHLVAGYPRSGKTELLVRGFVREALDRGRQVLYLTEESKGLWATRLRMIKGDWRRLHLVFGLGADVTALIARAIGGSEDIFVVDAVRNLLHVNDENDNSEVARVMNPWIAAARDANKTPIFVHHNRKGGGEHGEGIAGGHALLGVCDVAIEVVYDRFQRQRRLIRAYSRIVSPNDLLYEMRADGSLQALGDPREVSLDDVKGRVISSLAGNEWATTASIVDSLGEPKPSGEQVRKALVSLAEAHAVERDPPRSAGDQRGKRYRWRLATSVPTKTRSVGP